MEYTNDGKNWFIRLERGEDLFESLKDFARKENLSAGHLSGIGALENVEIGAYYLERQEYGRKLFPDIVELLSLEGNLSLNEGIPFFHIHAILGDHNFQTFGGHLFSAEVAVTCEINFRQFDQEVVREPNKSIGLSLIKFCQLHNE